MRGRGGSMAMRTAPMDKKRKRFFLKKEAKIFYPFMK
jgi:hypothetical protein